LHRSATGFAPQCFCKYIVVLKYLYSQYAYRFTVSVLGCRPINIIE
jgi:hypothetical protein